jgi:hypothetical protein
MRMRCAGSSCGAMIMDDVPGRVMDKEGKGQREGMTEGGGWTTGQEKVVGSKASSGLVKDCGLGYL